MNFTARVRWWLAAVLALAGLATVIPQAIAQQPSVKWLQGTHAFRYVLYERQFIPLQRFEELAAEPAKTILIVLGDTRIMEENQRAIQMFVEQGGALFVATDHDVPMVKNRRYTWAGIFGLQFFGQPVLAPEESCYQHNEQCPLVLPTSRRDSPLFANLHSPVAVNRAGHLSWGISPIGKMLSALAVFPEGSWHRGIVQPERFFAAGSQWGRGRVLFLADHSVFINNMMLQEDTGNIGFTFNCLDWLREGGEVRRDRVLLYDDGELIDNLDVPVTIPPLTVPADPLPLVNDLIAGLERENMHNRLLLEHIGYQRVLAWIISALTVALAAYLLFRLIRSRFRLDAAAPLLAPTLARMAPTGTGLAQRHKALLAEGNLWDPARAMARDFFEMALGNRRDKHDGSLPPFQSSESWLARRFLDRLLQYLWRLAYGVKPERIAPAAFAHLAAQLDELKAALADGSLRFETAGTS
jgi:hypothetical protein